MKMFDPAHPGQVLREFLGERSVTEVASHLGVSRVALSRVLNGKAGVSAEMSLRLSEALGTSPDMWFEMQNAFDFRVASRVKRKRIPPLGEAA